MKTISKVFALMLVLALAIVPVSVATESTDAAIGFDGNPVIVSSFGDMNDGKVRVTVYNTSTSAVKVNIKAVDYNNEKVVFCELKDVEVPAKTDDGNGVVTKDMSWKIGNSGTRYVKITATADDGSEATNTIVVEVSHSIWNDPITYVVIVIIIIAIAVAVFLKLRANERVKKQDPNAKSFTQMREEKISADKEKSEAKKVSTEKKTYEAKTERKSKRKQ